MTLRVPLEDLSAGERELGAEASRYLLRVHRLSVGARCVAFDPAQACEADLEVVATGRKRATVNLSNLRPATNVARRSLSVLQGLAKGSKVDAVVRDATELGATRVVVVRCERSVKRDIDIARCERVALEAARQSGRGDMPEVEGPIDFDAALATCEGGLRVVLDPDAERAFGELDLRGPVVIAVGPEGGFSPAELEHARDAGFVCARLGQFVLRTETACAAALGAVAASAE